MELAVNRSHIRLHIGELLRYKYCGHIVYTFVTFSSGIIWYQCKNQEGSNRKSVLCSIALGISSACDGIQTIQLRICSCNKSFNARVYFSKH